MCNLEFWNVSNVCLGCSRHCYYL